MRHRHSGSCHCGAFGFEIETELALEQLAPRQCRCSFCTKHQIKWLADPSGKLSIAHEIEPIRYRFGTKTADFLICPNCGVVLMAACQIDGQEYGIANINCLENQAEWPLPASKSNFDGEGTGDRLSRRSKNWMLLPQPSSV